MNELTIRKKLYLVFGVRILILFAMVFIPDIC